MRRRVMLERAAWQLRHGGSVTDAAFAAGYESVEGFSRAFARAYGHLPSVAGSAATSGHWLPAPNGIHFHPPTSLWVASEERTMSRTASMVEQMTQHDLDDTRALIELTKQVDDADYRLQRNPGLTVLSWNGVEESLAAVLDNLVWSKEVWLAAIEGADFPERGDPDVASLLERHGAVAGRWLALVRDLDRRNAWDDRIVDALCDPPESFVLGSVLAHVLTYAAHRRQLARHMLREAGIDADHGDPIDWLRQRAGADS